MMRRMKNKSNLFAIVLALTLGTQIAALARPMNPTENGGWIGPTCQNDPGAWPGTATCIAGKCQDLYGYGTTSEQQCEDAAYAAITP